MGKYWYVTQNGQGIYLIGYCYGREGAEEKEIVEAVQLYCKDKSYRLESLMQVAPGLPMVNQIFPTQITEESRSLMGKKMRIVYCN